MPYLIDWHEKPWLAHLTLLDDSTATEFSTMIDIMNELMDNADGRVYWLIDLRESGPEKGRPILPGVLEQLTHFKLLANANCGQIAIVSTTNFLRFLVSMIVQSSVNQQPGGVPVRPFQALEPALAFLHEIAAIDERLARTSTLTDHLPLTEQSNSF